jgi:hypothetical protein
LVKSFKAAVLKSVGEFTTLSPPQQKAVIDKFIDVGKQYGLDPYIINPILDDLKKGAMQR